MKILFGHEILVAFVPIGIFRELSVFRINWLSCACNNFGQDVNRILGTVCYNNIIRSVLLYTGRSWSGPVLQRNSRKK